MDRIVIQLLKNKKPTVEINFRVKPRDWMSKSIFLPEKTINALNKAAHILQDMSKGRYEIVLTRGYVNWNLWRYFKGTLGKAIFCFLYGGHKANAKVLFSPNGHDDGLSVDIQLYDVRLNKVSKFLSWRNIIIDRAKAESILEANKYLINMLDSSMNAAGFVVHSDPREKLQIHYRLESGFAS